MQGAPEGFNPSDSLIPRVQADIIGVQGGGGSMISLGWLSEVKNISFQNVGADGKLSGPVKVAAAVPVVGAPISVSTTPVASSTPMATTSTLPIHASVNVSTADANLGAATTIPNVSPSIPETIPTTSGTSGVNLATAPNTPIPEPAKQIQQIQQIQQTQPRDPKYIQKQEGLGCGRHALNNLFGFTYFTKDGPTDITDANINTLVPPIALTKLCSYLEAKNIVQENLCNPNEDYDASVLMAALAVIGHNSERISDKELFDTTGNKYIYPDVEAPTNNVLGYIINLGEATIK